MDLDLAFLQHPDHGLPRDAVQETVGLGRVHLAILHEEDVGARRLGHVAAIIEHHRVGTSLRLGGVFGHGADHVKARRLGMAGDGVGRGAFPLGNIQLGPLHLGVAVIGAPFPGRDGQTDRVLGGRDAHILARPAPGHRAHIGIGQTVGLHHLVFRGLDLVDGPWDVDIDHPPRGQQPFGMLPAFEDLAVIGALPLEHGRGVMHRMGQDMHIGVPPRLQLTIHPDRAVAIIIGTRH